MVDRNPTASKKKKTSTPESVKGYVHGGQTTPVEHLSVGHGKTTTLEEKVNKTQKAMESWERDWKVASRK